MRTKTKTHPAIGGGWVRAIGRTFGQALYMHTAALLQEQQQKQQARAREQAVMPISLELRHGGVNFLRAEFSRQFKEMDTAMNVKSSNSSFTK